MGYYTRVINGQTIMGQTNRVLDIINANFYGVGNFTLTDIYDVTRDMITRVYPNNKSVDATIRADVNALVNANLLTRVDTGIYKATT